MLLPEIVHVIDDDEGVRSSLCALLEAKRFVPKGHASCEEFLADYTPENTLCVVADLHLPGMGGLDLQTHLHQCAIYLPFIVITGHGDVSSAVRAIKTGAVDFIEKPVNALQLIAAVEKGAANRLALFQQTSETNLALARISSLTPRERDVLSHLIDGSPNKIIAHQLNISPRTVENHRARLMSKMQADSVAELVRLALAAGIPSST